MSYIKKELGVFKGSFRKLGKTFGYVLLLESLLLSIIIGGTLLWRENIFGITDDLIELRTELEGLQGHSILYGTQLRDETAVQVFSKVLASTAILAIILLIAWTLIKQKIYCMISKVKFARSTYWRWILTTIVWSTIAFIIFMVIQNLAFIKLGETFATKTTTRIIVFFIFTITYLLLYWLTINLFTHLIRTGKIGQSIKAWWKTAIKGSGRFLMPLSLSMIVFIGVNLLMFLTMLTGSPDVFMILSTILLAVYMTWARMYYTEVIDGMAVPARQKKKMHAGRHLKKMKSKRRPTERTEE